jgi:hypothetical protein
MNRYIKTNKQDLVRDIRSKAILNVNNAEYEAYKIHRDRINKALNAANEVDQLKDTVSRLESMLSQLINNKEDISGKQI